MIAIGQTVGVLRRQAMARGFERRRGRWAARPMREPGSLVTDGGPSESAHCRPHPRAGVTSPQDGEVPDLSARTWGFIETLLTDSVMFALLLWA